MNHASLSGVIVRFVCPAERFDNLSRRHLIGQEDEVIFIPSLLTLRLDQFSIECRKTKTIEITIGNYKERRRSSEEIKTQSKYYWSWFD